MHFTLHQVLCRRQKYLKYLLMLLLVQKEMKYTPCWFRLVCVTPSPEVRSPLTASALDGGRAAASLMPRASFSLWVATSSCLLFIFLNFLLPSPLLLFLWDDLSQFVVDDMVLMISWRLGLFFGWALPSAPHLLPPFWPQSDWQVPPLMFGHWSILWKFKVGAVCVDLRDLGACWCVSNGLYVSWPNDLPRNFSMRHAFPSMISEVSPRVVAPRKFSCRDMELGLCWFWSTVLVVSCIGLFGNGISVVKFLSILPRPADCLNLKGASKGFCIEKKKSFHNNFTHLKIWT